MNTYRMESEISMVGSGQLRNALSIRYTGRVDFQTFFHYWVMKHHSIEVWNPTQKVWAHCMTLFFSFRNPRPQQDTQGQRNCYQPPNHSQGSTAWPPVTKKSKQKTKKKTGTLLPTEWQVLFGNPFSAVQQVTHSPGTCLCCKWGVTAHQWGITLQIKPHCKLWHQAAYVVKSR